MSGAVCARLDRDRVHFQHGPIDLVIEACGEPAAVRAAHALAWRRFQGLLEGLVAELPLLRSPVQQARTVKLPVAKRMVEACWPYRNIFVTPMAAVAGAVADEVLDALVMAGVDKAYVNNGGDIALHLNPGESFRVGVVAGLAQIAGDLTVSADSPVRGVATSGWRGRSFSLGIADSVTVLAASAAVADAAATIIANAVNIDDAAIERRPACTLKDDTDLGERLVTVAVGRLPAQKIQAALASGQAAAQRLLDAGLICGAVLLLQGEAQVTGLPGAINSARIHQLEYA
ncbi:MAG: UPF0280 family protein [Betaproteobacteria bacterium]|nr:UPF0280 family protein [Betaproteobacteria bacterium]